MSVLSTTLICSVIVTVISSLFPSLLLELCSTVSAYRVSTGMTLFLSITYQLVLNIFASMPVP